MRLADAIEDFLSYLRIERGRAQLTLDSYTRELSAYRAFLAERGIDSIDDISRADISAYETSSSGGSLLLR